MTVQGPPVVKRLADTGFWNGFASRGEAAYALTWSFDGPDLLQVRGGAEDALRQKAPPEPCHLTGTKKMPRVVPSSIAVGRAGEVFVFGSICGGERSAVEVFGKGAAASQVIELEADGD